MISSNSAALESRPLTVIGYSNACPAGTGWAPTLPAAACRFSCWMAVMTSVEEISIVESRSGSSQIRMAYFRPTTLTSLTPLIRLMTSAT